MQTNHILYQMPNMPTGYNIGGKTGTAQWNDTKPNHAWFIGFAPYDQPDFAITVLVEEGGEGSSIAVPIAHEIINYWFGERGNK